jgi:hypothetical protein
VLGDKKRACNKTISRNNRKYEEKYKDKRKEAHKIFRQKRRMLLKSRLEEM